MNFATGLAYTLPSAAIVALIGIGSIAQFIVSIKKARLAAKNNSSKAFLWIGVCILCLAVLAWVIFGLWVLFFFHL
jgi:hypothetical protein